MTDPASEPAVFRAGDQWCYRAPAGYENSRLLIGAVVSFAESQPIICCAVIGAPRLLPDGSVDAVTIPFLPLTAAAMQASVTVQDGAAALPAEFGEALALWQEDARGLAAFTVPFEGRLDQLIARQMVAIVDHKVD